MDGKLRSRIFLDFPCALRMHPTPWEPDQHMSSREPGVLDTVVTYPSGDRCVVLYCVPKLSSHRQQWFPQHYHCSDLGMKEGVERLRDKGGRSLEEMDEEEGS